MPQLANTIRALLKPSLLRSMQIAKLHVVSRGRLGIEVEFDVIKLSGDQPVRTNLDVGANAGQTAMQFRKAMPLATIHSFEPVPDTFARLEASTAGFANLRTHRLAMGEVPGTARMMIGNINEQKSFVANSNTTEYLDLPVSTVDAFCAEHGIPTVDLLKIDIEGYELQVLRGADRLLSTGKIRFVYTECVFEPNRDMPHVGFLEINDIMKAYGFSFVSCFTESFVIRHGCAMCNVLFACRSSLTESLMNTRYRNVY